MSPSTRFQFTRLAVGSRVFGLVVLAAPVLWSRDTTAALALLAVGVIWLAATAAERLRVAVILAVTIEAALIGTVCALSLDSSLAVLGSLAVPPFTASLRRGPRGMLLALSAELFALVLLSTILRGPMNPDEGAGTFTWIVVGLGLGLIGSFVHSAVHVAIDPLTPYKDAQALIRELIDLSGSLSSGLDPVSLGATIAETVRDELPVSALLVQVPRDDGLSPLVTEVGDDPDVADTLHSLGLAASKTIRSATSGGAFAFPLMTDAGMVAVVSGLLPSGLDPTAVRLEARLEELVQRLEPTAVHLDTALLFTAFRDAATSDERRRLAREMHDGIAQDIASLGYLVDSLASRPVSPQQAAQLRQLRERISSVVTEVRRSVQSLRTEVGTSESLGAAISRLARHLSASSSIPIHVTVDEGTSRLRTEVEAELLRITQEAMTNAVRHAQPRSVEVRCRIHAPEAEIVVRDDGVGLLPARRDSQGIEIMHERARLIDAQLLLEDTQPHGTVVTVRVTPNRPDPQPPISQDSVTA